MNGRKAKALRKSIYGDADFRDRKYSSPILHESDEKPAGYTVVTIRSDKNRQWYQHAKTEYKRLKGKQIRRQNESDIIGHSEQRNGIEEVSQ